MDAIQRAQIERQARAANGQTPALTAPLVVLIIFAGAATYLNLVAGLVLFGAGGLGYMMLSRGRLEHAGDEGEEVPAKPSLSSPASRGQFISMGSTPQPNLLASVVHRSPLAGAPEPADQPPPATPETSFEVYAAAGPRQIAAAQLQHLKLLLKHTQEKINILDPILATRFHKNTQSELEIFLKAKDILTALTARAAALEQHLAGPDWDPAALRQSWELCFGPVDICRDPMSALMSEQDSERLTPSDCAVRLEAIFARLKKRKTFFKALQKDEL